MSSRLSPPAAFLLAALIALSAGAVALTHQSLWIDEAHTAIRASQPTLPTWWRTMVAMSGPDVQMPLYVTYMWLWEKMFGHGEVALRASNLPWLVAGVVALLAGLLRDRRYAWAVVALSVTNSFLWYYTSEARPYVMMFAFAAVAASALRLLVNSPADGRLGMLLSITAVALFGLCATTLAAVPWAFGIAVATALALRRSKLTSLNPIHRRVIFTAGIATAALALYYTWTLKIGISASHAGRTGPANIPFALYELTGIFAAGPGRLALRTGGAAAAVPYLPWIGIYTAAIAIIGVAAARALAATMRGRHILIWGCATLLPLSAAFLMGVFSEIRLLGRHCTPLLPFLLLFLGYGLNQLMASRRLVFRLLGCGCVGVFLAGALQVRFAPRHQRDDYRAAVAAASSKLAQEEAVWWQADLITADYYALDLYHPLLLTGDKLAPADLPAMIVRSRPDLFDPQGVAAAYIRDHDYTVAREFPAFQIWERRR